MEYIDFAEWVQGFFIAYIMFWHWFADFVCQNRWMARNKSEKFWPLFTHCLVYALIMSVTIGFIEMDYSPWVFLYLITTHFFTDMITSKFTKRYHAENKEWSFFTMIGFDQFIHFITLYAMFG